jgi:tetratricopeptide (TPR) repeat protein
MSRFASRGGTAVLLLALASVASYAIASTEGQADLDKATEVKLDAKTVSDLNEVIELIESALKKGLEPANVEFANRLLSATLFDRGANTARAVLHGSPSAPKWAQRREAAIADLERAVALDAKLAQAWLLIAQINLLPDGNVDRAREALDKVLGIEDENPLVRAKAFICRASVQNDPEKRLADLNEAVQLMPDNADILRARGELLSESGKLDAALADLDRAIALEPEDTSTYEMKAIVLARLKRFDEALATLDRAGQLSPEAIVAFVQKAREKPEDAMEDLNQALAKDPDNVNVLMMRAALYQIGNDQEKALADADRALKLKPDVPIVLRTHAVMLAAAGDYEAAIQDLEKLQKLFPNNLLTLLQLGELYSARQQYAKAIDAYAAVLTQLRGETEAVAGPEDSTARTASGQAAMMERLALRRRADAYLNIGKHAEAIADYEKALTLQPKDAILLNNLAWVLATSPQANLRDGKRAIQLATEACDVTKYETAYMLSTLAAAYAETGDFETAVKWSTKAAEIGDEDHDDSLKKELESYKAHKPWRESLSDEKPVEKP